MCKKIRSLQSDRNTAFLDELDDLRVLNKHSDEQSKCLACQNDSSTYSLMDRRTWMEYYMRDEPASSSFWRFVKSVETKLAFCCQECATAVSNKYKLEYLMYLTNNV